MAEATQFTIGAEATCTDGVCGDLSQIVIDPVGRVVTHLVVEPKHRSGLGRLVPLDLLDDGTEDIRLRCTMAEFEKLDRAEETQFLPGGLGGYGGYAAGQTFIWPYYGLAGGGMLGNVIGGGLGVGNASLPVVHDTLPLGEVAVRRGDQVHATDGDIGRVQGLVIDPSNRHVSHILLQEGHLWGRKEVAIPISAVSGVDEQGIRLKMSKDDVADLPPVDFDHLDAPSAKE
jgi:sporulation protein YlmC with PRC-barrel domain